MSSRYLRIITLLAFSGVLFSGYLSGVRFFTEECALNEPCPFFLGYPACYFGFAMFFALFLVSFSALVRKPSSQFTVYANLMISTVGILFAGYFALLDIRNWATQGFTSYALGLSSCIYGAIFFVLIWIISLAACVRPSSDSSQ